MTAVNPGAVSNNTSNVAGKLYAAWVDTSATALVGPSGQNVAIGGGAQTVQTQASGAIAGTGFSSTTTAGTVIVGTHNTGGLSLGVPAYITTYVAQTAQTQATGNIAGVGTTTTTQAGSTLGATLSTNGLSLAFPAWVTAGGGGFTGGVSNIGNTAGNTGAYTGQMIFAGGNNVTLSVSTVAGQNQTITISAANTVAQTNQSIGYYAVGNTTQNSSTTLDARTVSFDFLGAMTGGFSNGSIQVSAPATSSISGTGLVSVAVNGSTISIGAALPQLSFYQPLGPVQNTTVTQNGLGSVQVYPALAAFPFTATRADIMASISAAALALSTQAQTLSMYIGLYSLNGSTLSLASSGSQSYAWSNNSNGSNASVTGMRRFSAPINVNYTGGVQLFLALMTNTTFVNTNGVSLSNVVVPLGPGPQLQGLIGQTQVNSMQFVPGQGFFSVSSAALPASIALAGIVGAGSGGNAVDYYAPVQFANVTA